MALRFRELPWYVQTLIYFLVAVAIFAGGLMLDVSPVKAKMDEKARLEKDLQDLTAQVSRLQAVKQQHQEFETRLKALEEQLARSRTFVPEEKKTDDFIRLVHSAAVNTQIALRRLSAQPVVMKEFYAEIPFDVQLDGAYYDLVSFYTRLKSTTRIVNAGKLHLEGVESGRGDYNYPASTTVKGTCTISTYYTPSEAELAAAAPPAKGARGARPAGRR